ncbi:hypothetical protein [Streptomyces caeruleatus]|uniref:hypothetical protein n=1 Tax=Streptomyces caeruleatus TaxID=661399 RepID=UPI00131C9CC8|nr:hypothetical protein [Streptomyces caeruleatus]
MNTNRTRTIGSITTAPVRRTESGTPPGAADEHSPDDWEANHAVLARLAEHRVGWRPG